MMTYLFRSSRSRRGFCHSFTPIQTNFCAKTESCLGRQAYGKHTRAVCGLLQVSSRYKPHLLPMVLLFIVSATCSMTTSNGKPRNKQLITFLKRVIKSHTPSSLQLSANYCLSITCVCCLPSGHAAAASGIKCTDLLSKCLCSSNVYFYLIMALKYKAMLTKIKDVKCSLSMRSIVRNVEKEAIST